MSGIVVMGAAGGCGTTTFACALALALAGEGESVLMIDLDAHGGGPSALWGIPATRVLDDIHALGDGIAPEHLDHLVHRHPSGIDVMAGARAPQAVTAWAPAAAAALTAHVTARGSWLVDAGRGDTGVAAALVARAGLAVVLVPRTVHGANRAARMLDRDGTGNGNASGGSEAPRRAVVVATELPGGEGIPERALARATGHEVIAGAPRDDRAAARVASAQAARGRGLARAVACVRGAM